MKFGEEGTPAKKAVKKASRPAKNYEKEISYLAAKLSDMESNLELLRQEFNGNHSQVIPAKLIGEIEVLVNKVETSLGKAKDGNGSVAKAWRAVKAWIDTF